MDGLFSEVDALIGPFTTKPMLVASNFTGYPYLQVASAGRVHRKRHLRGAAGLPRLGKPGHDRRSGRQAGQMFRVPGGISLWGWLFQEGLILTSEWCWRRRSTSRQNARACRV